MQPFFNPSNLSPALLNPSNLSAALLEHIYPTAFLSARISTCLNTVQMLRQSACTLSSWHSTHSACLKLFNILLVIGCQPCILSVLLQTLHLTTLCAGKWLLPGAVVFTCRVIFQASRGCRAGPTPAQAAWRVTGMSFFLASLLLPGLPPLFFLPTPSTCPPPPSLSPAYNLRR